jgi:hypothetical protein
MRHGIFTAVELGHGQRFCYEKEILRKDTNLPFLLPMLKDHLQTEGFLVRQFEAEI